MGLITRELVCSLTDGERRAKGQEIARAIEEISTLEEEKKAATRDLNEQIKTARKHVAELARHLREGSELRIIDCREDPEYRTGTMRIVRSDNGEVVEVRALKPSERQAPLFEVKPRKKGEKAEAST